MCRWAVAPRPAHSNSAVKEVENLVVSNNDIAAAQANPYRICPWVHRTSIADTIIGDDVPLAGFVAVTGIRGPANLDGANAGSAISFPAMRFPLKPFPAQWQIGRGV